MWSTHRVRRSTAELAGLGLVLASALVGCGASDDVPTAAPSESATPTRSPDVPHTTTPAAAPPSTGHTAAPAVAASCRSAGLSVTLGPSEGAAGTIYRSMRFTNAGVKPCVLHGFPGVSYVRGDNGTQVGPAAERDGTKGGPVTLAPGAVGSAGVGLVNVGNFDAGVCHPIPVKGLRVYPPGETASVFVAAPGTGCSGNPPEPQLRVRTVRPGPGES